MGEEVVANGFNAQVEYENGVEVFSHVVHGDMVAEENVHEFVANGKVGCCCGESVQHAGDVVDDGW